MRREFVALMLMAFCVSPATAQVDSLTAPVDTMTAPADTAAAPVLTTPPPADPIALVRDLEARRSAALVAADTNTLAGIMAEDATFAHSNGLMQTRAELFTMLTRGEIRYLSIKPEDARYRRYGDAVIGTGVQSVNVKSAGKSMTLRNRYTVVYALTAAGPKMVAYQSTSLPQLTTRSR
jgi:ketosteroid isomerase-like protein